MNQDIVRVLRVVEYEGPRDQVEQQVKNSIHGERQVRDMTIRAATINEFPTILKEQARADHQQTARQTICPDHWAQTSDGFPGEQRQ